jgi:hypothetical protein
MQDKGKQWNEETFELLKCSSIQHCKVLRLSNKQANKKKNLIGFQELNPLIS